MQGTNFDKLVAIMAELREKCPWDKKQTIQTLRTLTLEESYELTDSIIVEDWQGIKEELGDLLLHITFYSKIAEEQGRFNIDDVLAGICEKLVRRHPHIYGDKSNETLTEEQVLQNWEQLKLKEGKKSVLGGVPKSLPALVKSIRLQEKSKKVGFEWENKADVWTKVEEELKELKEAEQENDINHIEEEFGDLLFSLINYSRFLKIDAETALEKTNIKFKTRFEAMEAMAMEKNVNLGNLTLNELNEMWETAKNNK
ncbi:nucleoside triphosphate pyrophosphohydrolase [Polluticaenibacter yanchengensis]|uniref:Nucleoside triphosphate pyrophosphohydrolase n=1 Tax=Polluticaenibacter yanchengensis TaxID=3014562 RepID=A0ABT4UI63_9BACT|nr:nucleoside triphosphate pyrophosphohydrolase [Chitinophagaceae bacterium LY-5]